MARGGAAEQGPVEEAADEGVAGFVDMAAVDRVLESRLGRELLPGGIEEVDEREAPLLGDGLGGVAVEGERIILLLGIGQVGTAAGLDRDGRHDHEPRSSLRVVAGILTREFVEELLVVGCKRGDAPRPGERLIEPEEEQVGVGAEGGERVVEFRVVARPLPIGHFVGRAGKVADHEVLAGKSLVHERFEVAEEIHPLGGGVADEHDPLAIKHLQRQPARRQRGPRGPRRDGEQVAGRLQGVGFLDRLVGGEGSAAGQAQADHQEEKPQGAQTIATGHGGFLRESGGDDRRPQQFQSTKV